MTNIHFLVTAVFCLVVYGQDVAVRQDKDSSVKLETVVNFLQKLQSLENNFLVQENVLVELKSEIQRLQQEIDQIRKQVGCGATGETLKVLAHPKNAVTKRTCEEIRSSDPSSTSGMYWIDPDGPVGDAPISVYCDMEHGTTIVSHDTEGQMKVESCLAPGCYSRNVNYNTTDRQLRTLTQLSLSCRQFIQVDCLAVPFEFEGVNYAWWNDINGNEQYFWAGSNSSAHTCQCGIDMNCTIPSKSCNCDTMAAIALMDQGYITSKNLLPMSRLNFGRASVAQVFHTLGKLECSGREVIRSVPKSCSELWQMGQTMSGIYSVKGSSSIQSVHCDFTKLPEDQGFETLIGSIDVKSSPIYFNVHRSADYNVTGSTLPYDREILNMGGGMNLTSGIFTAPVQGMYYFSFNGLRLNPAEGTQVQLRLNGEVMGHTYAPHVNDYSPLFLASNLNLKVGDEVGIWLTFGALANSNFTNFNGILLQEYLLF